MIHSSYYRPRVYPFSGTGSSSEIDRLQELTGTTTLNRAKLEEIGRVGIIAWRKNNPSVALTMRQLEYGNIEFWNKLANKSNSNTKVELTDFKTSMVDIAGYKTDDSGTFLGTMWYPKVRTSGFGITIGDPEGLIERNFNLVGEDEIALENNNKYFIVKDFTATGGTGETFTVNDPVPSEDPDNSSYYLFRVVRLVAGVATELVYTTDYSYDGIDTLTVNTTTAGDVIRVYYSAPDYMSGQSPFTNNDADVAGITADSCSIYLTSGQYVYRLQSVGIDVTFDRYDVKEIGNFNVVQRGIRDTTARITLGRLLEQWTIEEVLRGVAGLNYGKIDVRKFTDNNSLIVKIYSDNTKTDFLLGYKITDVAPTGVDAGTPLNDYVRRNVTLEGETGFITSNEGDL